MCSLTVYNGVCQWICMFYSEVKEVMGEWNWDHRSNKTSKVAKLVMQAFQTKGNSQKIFLRVEAFRFSLPRVDKMWAPPRNTVPPLHFLNHSICVLWPYLSYFSFFIISIWWNLDAPPLSQKIGKLWMLPSLQNLLMKYTRLRQTDTISESWDIVPSVWIYSLCFT